MIELKADKAGTRLDKFLSDGNPDLGRTRAHEMVAEGLATVNGNRVKPGYKLCEGDVIRYILTPAEVIELRPESIPLDIVFEDDEIIVLNKPPGMVVHPGAGVTEHTLANALLAHCPSLENSLTPERPGIVHRLDKDTSGLIVIAKTPAAYEGLVEQFSSHTMSKGYTALAVGHVSPKEGIIDAPIGRDPANRKRMAVVEKGKEARTRYHVAEYLGDHTLLDIAPETGRTHQIRVHMAAIGHPVAGDNVYGTKSDIFKRQFLHASRLAFTHPVTSQRCEFSSPLPDDLRQGLEQLRRSSR